MLNIGFSEILLFGIIALIVLGPEKLPIAVRTAGRWYAHIRRLVTNVQRDIEQELQLAEMREHMQKELDRIKSMEQSMQQQLNQMHDDLAELNPQHSIKPNMFTKLDPSTVPANKLAPLSALTGSKSSNPAMTATDANEPLTSSTISTPLLTSEQRSPS